MPSNANFGKFKIAVSNVRISHQIIVLLSCILVGIFTGAYMVVDQLKTLRNDAFAINNLGVIRGSIQRVSKRELNNLPSVEQIKHVDKTFQLITTRYLQADSQAQSIEQLTIPPLLKSLEKQWTGLKGLYDQHRQSKNLTKEIIEKSELCWDLADNVVYQVQKLSEIKLNNYRNMLILILSLVSVFVAIVIVIVYRIIHNELEKDALYDSLTGLFNRHHFNKILEEQMALFNRYRIHFTLTIIDIDYFKKINDEFGHPKGDEVLSRLANLLKDNTRDVDYLFRIGGEEFAVISPHCDSDQAIKLSEKYRSLVSKTDFDINRSVTISLGIAQTFDNCTEEDLYKNADLALYEAKSSGRNRTVSFQLDE